MSAAHTPTDRELLELAAKAAGVPLDLSIRPDGLPLCCPDRGLAIDSEPGWWNPLTDDGDALRLAVKLGTTGCFRINMGCGAVSTDDPAAQPFPMLYACENMETSDPYAATRLAIVRAAAALAAEPT